MQEIMNYKAVKDFSYYNKLNFSKGFVIENFIEQFFNSES
jgi:hypothetical protein